MSFSDFCDINIYVQIAGCTVFGVAIWVLVDSPKFMELFEKVGLSNFHDSAPFISHFQTKDVVSEDVDTSELELSIYSTAVYVFLALSAFFVIVSFFGCCGAWKVPNS